MNVCVTSLLWIHMFRPVLAIIRSFISILIGDRVYFHITYIYIRILYLKIIVKDKSFSY
jgi:hypothetical protein